MEKSVHTPDYAALRAELRQARDAANLSQRDLATRLGVAHSWVAKVETGERRIDLLEFCWFFAACDANVQPALDRLSKRIVASAKGRRSRAGRHKA